MKSFLLTLATFALATSAHALPRPDIRAMTCRDAASLVDSKRAVVFTTGKYTYERVVSSRYSCYNLSQEVEVKTYAKTTDNDRCFIGYICQNEEMAGNGSSVIGASAPFVCQEGKTRMETHRNSSDNTEYIRLVCRSGKWIEISRR
jgi:hypothetical protein